VPSPSEISPAAIAASERDLGATLVHERVVAGVEKHRFLSPGAEVSGLVETARTGLSALAAAGVTSIVDTTPLGFARVPELVSGLADASPVPVVWTTGLDPRSMPSAVHDLTAERLAGALIAELQDGIAGTGVRAEALTLAGCGSDEELARKLLLAIGFAHAETGAPIIASAGGDRGVRQLDGLMAHGIEPDRVLVAHLDDADGCVRTIDEAAGRGARLGFTRIGDADGIDDGARAALAAYAIRRYGVERVCLGCDAAVTIAGDAADAAPYDALPGFRERLAAAGLDTDTIDAASRQGAAALLQSEGFHG